MIKVSQLAPVSPTLEQNLSVNSTNVLSWSLDLKANRLYYRGDREAANPHVSNDRRAFPAYIVHSPNVGPVLQTLV